MSKGIDIKKRKGSVTVFVMIFFVTLVSMIFIFIDVSKKIAVNGSTDALASVWGNSILAEYDLNLQKRYNIFGFYGLPSDVNKKLDFYAKESFEEKKYIDYEGVSSSLYEYSLANADVMKKQIIKAGNHSGYREVYKAVKRNRVCRRIGTRDDSQSSDFVELAFVRLIEEHFSK